MIGCISEVTILPASFAEDVQACAAAGCTAMEVWLTKLETHLESHSLADTHKLLADEGVTLPAAAYQGGLLVSQGEQRRVHFDHFRKRLEMCQACGIGTMLVIADFLDEPDATTLQRASVSLRQAAQWAAGFDVRLAMEFRSRNRFCASLDTALAFIAQCQEPNLGVNLDLFHFWTGPSKLQDLALLTPDNLAFVQVCDLVGVPRELASDADRILPGDGDLPMADIIAQVKAIGYNGPISVELMNPSFWQCDPKQVAELAMRSLQRLVEVGA